LRDRREGGIGAIVSRTLEQVVELVARREVRVSDHGYDELASEDILVRDILAGVADAVEVEDSPTYHKGSCV
jgi:hypothetical protein